MTMTDYYPFRQDLVAALVTDLIGPAAETEIIDDAPLTRYVVGILYPRQSGTIDANEDIDAADEADEDATADPPVALANVRYPSSIGMTFAVDVMAAPQITVSIRAARYIPLENKPENKSIPPTSQPRRAGKRQRWQREAVPLDPVQLDITVVTAGTWKPLTDGLKLFYRIRRPDMHGMVPVTVVLLNTNIEPEGPGQRDALAFFQPELAAAAPGTTGPFVERAITGVTGNDADLRSYKLLYRHAREFATGHGCSVRWEQEIEETDRAIAVATTFAPHFEVPLADSNPHIKLKSLEMRSLVDGERFTIIQDLGLLCDGYKQWIDARQSETYLLDPELRATAAQHLEECTEAVRRMRGGLIQLQTNEESWQAFKMMNAAMLQQRARTVWLRNGRPLGGPDENSDHVWRPFQLAFILLCMEGIVDPTSPDRNYADLLWFPTGGGKTEAYLGLIAFTVFLRRLRRRDGGGVTALMRYTLRLLTIQQFERATLLICCCEAIRRQYPELGNEPISIGLWVGMAATPNNLDQARTAINHLRGGGILEEGNPCQVTSCPWCGTPLDHRNYWIKADKSAMVVACREADCSYKDGLPVFLVDDDVYNHRPTLIIATADKFAGLPWREQSADLFNLATTKRAEQPRPELIIQDELHLISGPLGTLAGLYETAIDLLCSQDGIRPKVIASTATIRRADYQARGLFNRQIRQFPPPGLDARDSYFAVEAPPEERGTRMYVGLMAPGTSHTTLMVRTYAALLQNANDLPASPTIKDPYWTLVGYFNSLRVLGGARMQVQDDVDDRMDLVAGQAGTTKRLIEDRIELTSRESSADIPEHLKRMAIPLTATSGVLDVILATNMISVGVDIDRLGLMVVMGQPQSTSEYIQSTSRVGRKYPGLVITLFNSARSRDRSHYESFVAYHSALYRQVESTSVTPFSARARDRGLHAVLVALVRLLLPEFRPNAKADQIATQRARLKVVKDAIIARVQAVAPEEVAATEQQLEALLDTWQELAVEGNLVYSNPRDTSKSLLVDPTTEGPERDEHFATLWSLRDVDRESNLFLM